MWAFSNYYFYYVYFSNMFSFHISVYWGLIYWLVLNVCFSRWKRFKYIDVNRKKYKLYRVSRGWRRWVCVYLKLLQVFQDMYEKRWQTNTREDYMNGFFYLNVLYTDVFISSISNRIDNHRYTRFLSFLYTYAHSQGRKWWKSIYVHIRGYV